MAPRALARHQQLDLQADTEVIVPGNETLLAVLLRNLIDNAVRYSPPGATVTVRVGGDGLLQVDDSGPGLADADLARLGERFFRVPGHDAPGSGLGWSIARRIAAAHGLVLRAGRSTALGGLSVRLGRTDQA